MGCMDECDGSDCDEASDLGLPDDDDGRGVGSRHPGRGHEPPPGRSSEERTGKDRSLEWRRRPMRRTEDTIIGPAVPPSWSAKFPSAPEVKRVPSSALHDFEKKIEAAESAPAEDQQKRTPKENTGDLLANFEQDP